VGNAPFVVVGAGGVGRECLDTAVALGVEVECFVDDGSAGSRVRDLAVVAVQDVAAGSRYLIAIADPEARRRLSEILTSQECAARTLVHPTATVMAAGTELGPGCLVMGGAYISSSVTVGAHVQVQYNATVGHDSVLEDRVTVLPGANVSGAVVLEAGVTVGSGAVVLQGRRIGAGAYVGAGAVVTRDVAAGLVVVGAPARALQG
jgi:sugar O-acyltransferase (sialic acid O-acetyltransferase NeuD family)